MRTGVAAGLLVLVWFLALIGGYFVGGWINLLLPLALLVYLVGARRDRPA